jgi:bifunctional ADP-heptose synthase (sugar kinase/adenylyltransferase)
MWSHGELDVVATNGQASLLAGPLCAVIVVILDELTPEELIWQLHASVLVN